MKRITRFVGVLLFVVFGLSISSIAEEITLTTYYPAPYGEYEELRANKFAVGSTATMPTTDGEFTTIGNTYLATDSGNVGIGTTSPNLASWSTALTISDIDTAPTFVALELQGNRIDDGLLGAVTFYNSSTQVAAMNVERESIDNAGTIRFYTRDTSSVWGERMRIKADGDVGIGETSPTAKLHVNGNIKAVLANLAAINPVVYNLVTDEIGYDVAELFNTSEEVEVGDVLVIDETKDLQLRKSKTPYEKGVVGITSGSPAILFEGSQLEIAPPVGGFTKGTKPPVALAGRIPCKVSLENGPIERGDLLTSSSMPGHAMKATDREKSFGAILGKALEPFNGGPEGEKTGKIIVLVTLQ
ncbi:MAG: hypothetical protein H8D54_01955 [Candidatus Omnitrophica bacterium]|nr:hypothetical protein [Candidatus Omnitrophota bacterium]